MTRSAILFAALAACAMPASARPIDADWPEVASANAGQCTISVTGNGKFYLIAIEGLEPGESGHYRLENGDMTPIDWSVRADGNGRFARYYLPFRWHRQGGTVTVSLSASSCNVSTAFDWQRAGIGVI